MSKIGRHAFISYLRNYYNDASALRDSLENGFVDKAELIPPDKLCVRGQILTPAETLELIQNIAFYVKRADTFVILYDKEYSENYFTQMEMIQWINFEKPSNIYIVKSIA